jgi:TusA-related sulfurtransferase
MSEINVDVRDPSCPGKDIRVDVCGEQCPVPLVETRKALRKASPGDTVIVVGTHTSSKEEIPMAVKALGLELESIEESEGVWTIRIRR